MKSEEYLQHDMIGLAELVARREVTASEVLEAAIERMASANPKVNAVVLDLSEQARKEAAGQLSGPLAGAPYLIKDLGAAVAGAPTTLGSRLFKDNVPAADSALTAALRRAGVVIFGKTNTPELGLEPVTEPELFGPARNPWDLERSPGGSSGGASAAVSAGIVPAAHASDGGGSIRIPASCTGLFGMKPSRGRVSFAPGNEGWGGFSVQHAVTRSVRDSALLLDIVSQPQPGDPYWQPPPDRPFLEHAAADPGSLRIGFSTAAFAAGHVGEECQAAVHDAARLCESLGHKVQEATLPGDFPLAAGAAGVIVSASIAATIEAEVSRRGRPVEQGEIDELTAGMYERGKTIPASDYIRAVQIAHAFGRGMARFFDTYDVLLNSPLGSPALRIGELRGRPLDLHGYTQRLFDFMPNTQAANISGQPAMSVPLAWSASGLPIGIQFTARSGDEATLFRLAGQLEKARPWAHLRPAAFS
ncbi:MAG: amidase [Caulobacterales bacterium]